MSQVHYWELQQYNEGTLVGRWFDLDGKTEDEHTSDIEAWLAELTASPDNTEGNLYEEWIMGDVEGVPLNMVSEWSIGSEFFDMQAFIAEGHYDEVVVLATLAVGVPFDKVADVYAGEFKSDEELGEDYCESTGLLDTMPDSLRGYFDMHRFGRDMAMDYSEHNGHYFHINY
jgi:antirestriction protein